MHLAPGYRVSWKIQPDLQTIRFTLALEARAWLGIGWHCANISCVSDGPGMTHADFAIAIFNDTTGDLIEVFDGVSSPQNNGFKKPLRDTQVNGTNDIRIVSAYQTRNPDFTVVTFERKLVTNDIIADHPLVNTTMNFIWAHGDLARNDSNTFHFHGPYAGVVHINPFAIPSSDEVVTYLIDLRKWHGTCMTVAFSLIMSWAIFVARYLKGYYWWFSLHIIMQLFALGFVIAATFLIILMKVAGGYEHFVTLHAKLGLAVVIVLLINVLMGVISHVLYNPRRLRPPLFPDKVHWYIGRLVLVAGYVNIILGFLNPNNGFAVAVPIWVAFCIVVGLYLVIVVYLELYHFFLGDKGTLNSTDSRSERKPLLNKADDDMSGSVNVT